MLTISYNKINYTVYETQKEADEHNIAYKHWSEANEGDYVLATNGFVVPLIRKCTITAYKTRVGGKYYARKTPKITTEYLFPRRKFKVFQSNNLSIPKKEFFYDTPYGVIMDLYAQTGAVLTSHKMYFGMLIANGFPPKIAINIVHNDNNKYRNRKRMFAYMLCPQTILYISKVFNTMNSTLKQELEQRGINKQSLADRIVKMIDDAKEPVVLRKWAYDQVARAFDEDISGGQANIGAVSYLPQGVDPDQIKARLLLRAHEAVKETT